MTGALPRLHPQSLVTAVAASLIAGLAISYYFMILANRNAAETGREATRANRRYKEVRKLANLLIFEIHESIRDLPGATKARERLVITAKQYLEGLLNDGESDPEVRHEVAIAYMKIGDIQGNPTDANLGDPSGASRSYEAAIHLVKALVDAHPERTGFLATLARGYSRIGDVNRFQGESSDARALYEKSFSMYQKLASSSTDGLPAGAEGLIHQRIGDIHADAGEYDAALSHYRECLRISKLRSAKYPNDPLEQHSVAINLTRIGKAYRSLGKRGESLGVHQEAFALRRELRGRFPNHTQIAKGFGVSQFEIAIIMHDRREYDEAIRLIKESEKTFGELTVDCNGPPKLDH